MSNYAMSNYGMGLDVPTPLPGNPGNISKVGPTGYNYCGSAYGMQQMLSNLGYYGGAIDGSIGPASQAAMKRFGAASGAPDITSNAFCQALIAAWTKKTSGGAGWMSHLRVVDAKTGGAPNYVAASSSGGGAPPRTASWLEKRTTTEKIAIGLGATAVTVGVLYALMGWGKIGTYSANRSTPPRRKKKWAQAVDRGIARRGTEGALTRQARRAGYDNTLTFARKAMAGWRNGSRTMVNKKTGKKQPVTVRTMRRANFALNVQPKKKR